MLLYHVQYAYYFPIHILSNYAIASWLRRSALIVAIQFTFVWICFPAFVNIRRCSREGKASVNQYVASVLWRVSLRSRTGADVVQ